MAVDPKRADPLLAELHDDVEQKEYQRALAHHRRAERMHALKAQGWSLQQLADAIGCKKQRISAILKAPPRTVEVPATGSGLSTSEGIGKILHAATLEPADATIDAEPVRPPATLTAAEARSFTAAVAELDTASLLQQAWHASPTRDTDTALLRDAGHRLRRGASTLAQLAEAIERQSRQSSPTTARQRDDLVQELRTKPPGRSRALSAATTDGHNTSSRLQRGSQIAT